MTDLARPADLTGPSPEMLLAFGFLASTANRHARTTRMIIEQWYRWCERNHLQPMQAQRVHFELWMRELDEVDHLKPSTINGKIGCVSQLYRHAVIDGYLPGSPCQWIKRPSVPRKSTTNGLTRPEFLAVLDLARDTSVQDHAICCILGLNGLRVGELCAIRIEDIGRDAGYHTIKIVRLKSREEAVIPLARARRGRSSSRCSAAPAARCSSCATAHPSTGAASTGSSNASAARSASTSASRRTASATRS
jgi:site-specific recombinase XerD